MQLLLILQSFWKLEKEKKKSTNGKKQSLTEAHKRQEKKYVNFVSIALGAIQVLEWRHLHWRHIDHRKQAVCKGWQLDLGKIFHPIFRLSICVF